MELSNKYIYLIGLAFPIGSLVLCLLAANLLGNRRAERKFAEWLKNEEDQLFNKEFLLDRVIFKRGGRGKNSLQPLKWVAIQSMNNKWLEACITYEEERGCGDSTYTELYRRELAFREEFGLVIEEEEDLKYQTALEDFMIWMMSIENKTIRGEQSAQKIISMWSSIQTKQTEDE